MSSEMVGLEVGTLGAVGTGAGVFVVAGNNGGKVPIPTILVGDVVVCMGGAVVVAGTDVAGIDPGTEVAGADVPGTDVPGADAPGTGIPITDVDGADVPGT